MKVCSNKHTEICFEDNSYDEYALECPLCEVIAEFEDFKKRFQTGSFELLEIAAKGGLRCSPTK